MKLRTLIFCSLSFSSVAFADDIQLAPVIDNSAYPAGTAPIPQTTGNASGLYELMGRLEELQATVQQLTGKIEEQNQTINDLKKKHGALLTDFEDRLTQIESKARKSSVTASNVEPPVESKETTEEAKETKEIPESKPATSNNTTQNVGTPPAKPSNLPPEYQQAFEALRNGRTQEAITQFSDMLEKSPQGQFAGNAQYWLGEAYKANKDVDSAKKAFSAVIDKYPNSQKVPDALLKLSYIELEQKNVSKAKEYLNRIANDFPNSKIMPLVTKKLTQLNNANPTN